MYNIYLNILYFSKYNNIQKCYLTDTQAIKVMRMWLAVVNNINNNNNSNQK